MCCGVDPHRARLLLRECQRLRFGRLVITRHGRRLVSLPENEQRLRVFRKDAASRYEEVGSCLEGSPDFMVLGSVSCRNLAGFAYNPPAQGWIGSPGVKGAILCPASPSLAMMRGCLRTWPWGLFDVSPLFRTLRVLSDSFTKLESRAGLAFQNDESMRFSKNCMRSSQQ